MLFVPGGDQAFKSPRPRVQIPEGAADANALLCEGSCLLPPCALLLPTCPWGGGGKKGPVTLKWGNRSGVGDSSPHCRKEQEARPFVGTRNTAPPP